MANQVLYGFYQLKDLFTERVSDSLVPEINRAIDATTAEHNRSLDALLGLFAARTTEYKERYKSPVTGRLQPLDENGRARPVKRAGFYDVAYPLQMGGTAWGANFVTRAKMTVGEVNDALAGLITSDTRWLRDHVLAALFAADGWTFTDELHGDLTVEGLANGDDVNYLIQSGGDAGTTDNHLLAQAAAIADGSNPFPGIYDELIEHPENAGEVVSFVPSNVVGAIEGLATFKEKSDANIREGANTSVLVGNLQAAVPGRLIGYADRNWIVEWPVLPDNYIVAVTTDGDRPLAMREDPEDELRGFRRVADRNDHPYYESQYIRRAGFGGRNRVGAVVQRVGNGTYATPTNYSSPMA